MTKLSDVDKAAINEAIACVKEYKQVLYSPLGYATIIKNLLQIIIKLS